MTKLALLGGPRAVPKRDDHTEWPVITTADEEAVLRVLRSGHLAATGDDEPEIGALERAWADLVGVRHCAAVGNGTAALQVALAAHGVGHGDEVVVPALSMNATAVAVVAQGAIPVFADIDPRTFTMDPVSLMAAMTERTAAIMPVHLHGLPADMEAVNAVARLRPVPVIEDAAQAHGAMYQGVRVGALADAGCFSMHPSKNLPTCGEGGLITTDSDETHEAITRIRLFGERLEPGKARTYVAYQDGLNAKLSPVQAAFARSQLTRFSTYTLLREAGIVAFLGRLAQLPGLVTPLVPEGRTHVWHILRMRLVPAELDMPDVPAFAVRQALHRVLRAEGVPVSRYQVAPLPAHPAFRRHVPAGAEFPVAQAVLEDSLCLQRRHLNPHSADVLAGYADAFEKVWEHLGVVRRIAAANAGERKAVPA
uniref:Uncharacterized protein n=1 Tax=uncultured bacterium esnapd17 TaxID=1366598 RepID=S5TN53_9BACT|nr:FIG01132028: hypothetical protein [uncultured bacterium esnapd17]